MDNLQVNIKLPLQAWNIVLAALAKRPLEEVLDLFGEIKKQAESQVEAAKSSEQPASVA
jgi:hypothetical protein